jgi:hypothetical protein
MGCSFQWEWDRSSDNSNLSVCHPAFQTSFRVPDRMLGDSASERQSSHRPHFHAYYQNASAVYAYDSIECIGGSLPRSQSRLVEAWAELHCDKLVKDWELLQSGHPPVKIAPLQ